MSYALTELLAVTGGLVGLIVGFVVIFALVAAALFSPLLIETVKKKEVSRPRMDQGPESLL